MAQNIVINGTTYNGVDSVELTNTAREKIKYIESPYPATGNTVAKIGSTEYTTVAEALANAVSGDTVLMVASSTESGRTLVIPDGVTLSLNGKTLTAECVTGTETANVIDGTGVGKIIVQQNKLILSQSNASFPAWDGTGYIFDSASIVDNKSGMGVVTDAENDTLTFKFVPFFGAKLADPINALFTDDGSSNNNVEFLVHMEWTTSSGIIRQEIIFNDTQVKTIIAADGRSAFTYSFSGYTNLAGLKIRAIISSGTGVELLGTLYTINE